jgi:hypothetical protein
VQLSIGQVQACKDTALICEACVNALSKEDTFDTCYQRSLKQCQDLCGAFLHAASIDSIYLEKIALLCIGLCEECIEICTELKEENLFKKAILTFQNCSDLLSTEFLQKSASYSLSGER